MILIILSLKPQTGPPLYGRWGLMRWLPAYVSSFWYIESSGFRVRPGMQIAESRPLLQTSGYKVSIIDRVTLGPCVSGLGFRPTKASLGDVQVQTLDSKP